MSEKYGSETKRRGSNSSVFYEQLQSEYNELLKRYAEAENTIDELRTGAKIRLYSDTQDIQPHTYSISENTRHSQLINIPRPLQAVVSPTGMNEQERSHQQHHNGTLLPTQSLNERVKLLKENVQSLENCLCENDITIANLKEIFGISNELRDDLKKINSDYSSKPSEKDGRNLINKNEMKKELHRVQLRLDEIQQDVNGKLKLYNPPPSIPKHKFDEISSRQASELFQPENEEEVLIDSDLANLITKLKQLKDATFKSNETVLESPRRCKPAHRLPADRYNSDHNSSGFQDFVDARYLLASPDHLDQKQTFGSEIDQFTEEDDFVNNDQHLEISRDLSDGIPGYSDQPTTSYDLVYDHYDNISENERVQTTSFDHENEARLYKNPRSRTPDNYTDKHHLKRTNTEENTSENKPRKSNSVSSLAGSSRMSTPLFHPRGPSHDAWKGNPRTGGTREEHGENPRMPLRDNRRVSPRDNTRVSPRDNARVVPSDQHDDQQKDYHPINGFDSGFFGSEESRSSRMTTTESPNIMQKLNLSHQYDSSLRLDLSGINESETESSPEHSPRLSEVATKSDRRCSAERSPPETLESTLVNTSSLSSPNRNAKHFGYNTTYPPKRARDLTAFSRTEVARPSSSRSSKRQSSKRGSQVERTSGVDRDATVDRQSRRGSREVENVYYDRKQSEIVAEKNMNDNKRRSSLQGIRQDISTLRDQIENVLDQSRVSQDLHDDSRREDEQWRDSLERENDRRFDDLARSIEQLRNEIRLKGKLKRGQNSWKTSDDIRNRIKDISERLQELSELRRNVRANPSSAVSPSALNGSHMTEQFSGLEQKLDDIRQQIGRVKLQVENEPQNGVACPQCDDVATHHHGYYTGYVKEPRMSIPAGLTHVHYESPRPSTKKLSTLRNLSLSYPGAHIQSPVIHHVHTYHTNPKVKEVYETHSSSDESLPPRRSRKSTRPRRHFYRHRGNNVGLSPEVLDEARLATRDVQRLSKSILNKVTLDLASFNS